MASGSAIQVGELVGITVSDARVANRGDDNEDEGDDENDDDDDGDQRC